MKTEESAEFREYRLLILNELDRMNLSMTKLQDIVTTLAVEIGQLKIVDKTRASFFGGIAGLIAAVVITILLEKVLK